MTTSKNRNRRMKIGRSGQGGFSVWDILLWAALAAIILTAVIGMFARANNWMKQIRVQQHIGEIRVAGGNWKGERPYFTDVSMAELCKDTRNDLSPNICGPSKDGKNANPYGGDYIVTVSSNVSEMDVSLTDVDTSFIDGIADKLAGSSVDRCIEFAGCGSISVSGSTIKVTM